MTDRPADRLWPPSALSASERERVKQGALAMSPDDWQRRSDEAAAMGDHVKARAFSIAARVTRADLEVEPCVSQ